MGLVVCDTHGPQQGPLCCQHVLDGSYGRTSSQVTAADPRRVAFLRIDLLDDGSEMVDVVVCQECALRFGRVTGEILAGRHFGDENALPWVCPVCTPCLERWTGHPTPGWTSDPASVAF
jgi:hypothetical protein